jgi:hypothetical protein
VVEIRLVDRLEGGFIASVKTVGEFDGWVGARAEVESSALDLSRRCGVAGGLLSIAVSYSGTREFPCVGGIGACVILDRA